MADNKTTTYSHVRAFLSSRQTITSTAGRATDLLPNQGPRIPPQSGGTQVTGPKDPPASGQGQHIAGAVLRHRTMSQMLGTYAKLPRN
jgi:hypothetical protein